MLCDSIKVWFNDYLDGDLNLKKKKIVETHLEQCSHCRQEFDKLKQADDCLRLEVRRMFNEIPVPDGLFSRIEDRIKKDGTRLPFYKRLQSSIAGIAAALLIFTAAYGMFQQYFDRNLFHNVMNRESLSDVAESNTNMNTGDTGDNGKEDISTVMDSDIQKEPVVTYDREHDRARNDTLGGDAGGSPARQNQPSSNQETKMMVEVSDEPAVGGSAHSEKDKGLEDYRKVAGSGLSGEKPKDGSTGKSPGPSQKLVVNKGQAVTPLFPAYLPEGMVLESVTSGENKVCIKYVAGGAGFVIEEKPVPGDKVFQEKISEGKKVKINGQDGVLSESVPDGRVTVIFEQSGLLITMEGDLPVKEILRIAESLR